LEDQPDPKLLQGPLRQPEKARTEVPGFFLFSNSPNAMDLFIAYMRIFALYRYLLLTE